MDRVSCKKKNQVVVTLQKTSAHLQTLSIFGFNFGGYNTLKGILYLNFIFYAYIDLFFLPRWINLMQKYVKKTTIYFKIKTEVFSKNIPSYQINAKIINDNVS